MPRMLLIIILLLTLSTVHAQDSLAVPLEITYEGLSIRQQATEEWLELPDGAITALASGDAIRTDEVGRGILHFADYGTILLLPNSLLEIIEYEDDAGEISLELNVLGTSLMQFSEGINITINSHDMKIVEFSGSLGLWADENQADVIVVENGFVTSEFNDRVVTVGAGEGLRYHPDELDLLRFDAPRNRARLIGKLDGCEGLIRTTEGTRGVIVRTGPGQGFQARGLIEDDELTALLARTESSGWTRIQHANGFGWVLSLAVESDCELPRVPNNSPEEEVLRAVNADERELSMLRPFFGIVGLDGFFYQYTDDND